MYQVICHITTLYDIELIFYKLILDLKFEVRCLNSRVRVLELSDISRPSNINSVMSPNSPFHMSSTNESPKFGFSDVGYRCDKENPEECLPPSLPPPPQPRPVFRTPSMPTLSTLLVVSSISL